MTWFFDPTVAASQGSNAYSLALTSGGHTFAGTALSPLHAWRLALASGAHSFSGTSLSLVHAERLALALGAHAFSGTAVTLLHAEKLALAAGAHSFSGASVTFAKTGAYVIGIGLGAHAFSMGDVAFNKTAGSTAPPSGGGGVSAVEVDRFHDYKSTRRAKVRKLEETIVEAYAKLPGETKTTALDAVVEADGDPAKLAGIVESLASQLLSKDSIDKKIKFQKAERLRKANEAAVANMRRQAEELKAQRIAEFEEEQRVAHAMMLEEEAIVMLLLS